MEADRPGLKKWLKGGGPAIIPEKIIDTRTGLDYTI